MTDGRAPRAVLYLRVSSRGQLTGPDPEGFSIGAQREACKRMAKSLGAEVVTDYVDRAESAKSADRPELQLMLRRLTTERDIDYVIVHKVDRLARNRADDVTIAMQIKAAGAQLVSASENIDETPSGMLLHGIMSSIAEFYSQNLGAEVVKGITQKVAGGGTPGHAPIGYRHIRQMIDDREVRTVELDPERAPLIRWAFEMYATGRFSISELVVLLEQRGLRTKGNRRYGPRPVNLSSLHVILNNDYYCQVVTYKGKKYPGKHEALVSRTLFDQVQAVLHAHNLAGERDRKHSHYLKGTLYCYECAGRLMYSENSGNGGKYEYFVCANRQKGKKGCGQGFHRADRIEEAVERYYVKVQLTPERRERIRTAIQARIAEMAAVSERELKRCNQELANLAEQERSLLHKNYAGRVSDALYDEEQARIARERESAEGIIGKLGLRFDDIEATLDLALELVTDLQAAYLRATPMVRRQFNQAIFEGLDIREDEIEGVRLATPFAELLADDLLEELVVADSEEAIAGRPWPPEAEERVPVGLPAAGPEDNDGPDPWGPRPFVVGSISESMVGEEGIEPSIR